MKLSIVIPVWNQEKLVLKALKSIPDRADVECIIVNDGSTDKTHTVVRNWINNHKKMKTTFKFISYKENMGVSYALNRGMEKITGEYFTYLSSDDYYYTDTLNALIDEDLTGEEDMVYYWIKRKDDITIQPVLENVSLWVGSVKAYKTSFVGDITHDENIKVAEDLIFDNAVRAMNPKMKFTTKLVKFYNFPREGSLTDIANTFPKEQIGKIDNKGDQ